MLLNDKAGTVVISLDISDDDPIHVAPVFPLYVAERGGGGDLGLADAPESNKER